MVILDRLKTVRGKLILSISAIFVFVTTLFIIVTYNKQSREIIDNKEQILKQNYELVLEHINNSAFRAYSLAEWVAGTPDIQKCFAERDREKLQNLSLPIYESVKQKLNINKFQFHIPPATSFLRLHKPGKYGDDLSKIRQTVLFSNKNQEKAVGLDFGVCGFGIRGVTPVLYDGKHLGTVEFGVSLNDKLLMQLKKKYGFNVSIAVPDDQGFKFQARTYQTGISQKSYPFLKNVIETGQIDIRRVNKEKKMLTLFGPLKDFSGKVEGVIAIPADISADLEHLANLLRFYIIVGFVSLLSVLMVIYWIMNKFVLRSIKHIKNSLTIAINGDLKQRIQVSYSNSGVKFYDINKYYYNLLFLLMLKI